jgi:hypothetical protein
MAFSKVPTAWLPSWILTDTDTKISVPIASFAELTAGEADAASGDIRKIAFAWMEALWLEWNSLATADRPTKWNLTKTGSVNTSTGITTIQYVQTFYVETTAQDVADEPT